MTKYFTLVAFMRSREALKHFLVGKMSGLMRRQEDVEVNL